MTTGAPAAEERFRVVSRRYERIKLWAIMACLVVDIALTIWVGVLAARLIEIGHENHTIAKSDQQSLVILKCAVQVSEKHDANGQPLSRDASQRALEACIGKG